MTRHGQAGGNARRDALTPERRSEIASNSAKKRWERYRIMLASTAENGD
jgi:hypothetical protein